MVVVVKMHYWQRQDELIQRLRSASRCAPWCSRALHRVEDCVSTWSRNICAYMQILPMECFLPGPAQALKSCYTKNPTCFSQYTHDFTSPHSITQLLCNWDCILTYYVQTYAATNRSRRYVGKIIGNFRWRLYCRNVAHTTDLSTPRYLLHVHSFRVELISGKEFAQMVCKTKLGKAPGNDNIIADMLRYMRGEAKEVLIIK